MITYETKDSLFYTALNYSLSTVLPILAIIIPVMLWIYKKAKTRTI